MQINHQETYGNEAIPSLIIVRVSRAKDGNSHRTFEKRIIAY